MSNPSAGPDRGPMSYRDYRLLWSAQSVSDFGSALTFMTLIILVNQESGGSTAAVATMALVMALPQIMFGIMSGVWVDRLDHKRVMIVSDFIRALLVLALIPAAGSGALWPLLALAFIQAGVGTFFTPARGALLPSLVPRDTLLAANGLLQTSRIAANMLGTGLAGVLFGVIRGPGLIFSIDAATFIFALSMVGLIKTAGQPAGAPKARRPFWHELGEGLQTIRHSSTLSGVLICVAVADLGFGAVNVVMVPFLSKDLNVAVTWLGSVDMMTTAGMLAGGVALTLLARFLAPARIASLGLIVVSLLIATASFAPNIWWLIGVMTLMGLALAPMQASIQTIFQQNITRELRGRVGSVMSTTSQTAGALSMALGGAVGAVAGVRNVFVYSGVLGVTAGLLAMYLFREQLGPKPEVAAEPVPA